MAKTAFHHVALICVNPEKTVKFYEEGIGLRLWHVWGRGNKNFIMELGCGSYIEIMEEQHDEYIPNSCWSRVVFKSDDLQASYDKALKAGAKPLEEPFFVEKEKALPIQNAYHYAAVIGPEGEEIGFIQEVPADGKPYEYEEKIHHVMMYANNITKTGDMYHKAFGFPVGEVARQSGEKSCLVDLGDHTYFYLREKQYEIPMPRGHWAHIALRAEDILKEYDLALENGLKEGVEVAGHAKPVFCDVIEATPFPVQFWSSGFGGPDGEDITMIQDVII